MKEKALPRCSEGRPTSAPPTSSVNLIDKTLDLAAEAAMPAVLGENGSCGQAIFSTTLNDAGSKRTTPFSANLSTLAWLLFHKAMNPLARDCLREEVDVAVLVLSERIDG
jgi:hypothetical protein